MGDDIVKDDVEKEEDVICGKSQPSEDYEELFKNRYGEDDEYFQSSIKREVNPPPAIHPWYSKPRRNFDYARRRGGRHQSDERWGSSHGRHHSQHRDSHHSNGGDRRNDRHRHDRDRDQGRDDRRSENRHRPY